ncbi:hypothetical protein RI129_003989 [Pyrocoelia pectoralis]|uniref:Galectin n=1 Tax=Pyrocoelia pectoralis TaxID=417401 RepID=A0AAN7ZPH4_9COLE
MVQVINDPSVPFLGSIKGGLSPGSMIRIQGEVPKNADKFNVNLHCSSPPSDIALHMSIRLLQGYIARNSLENEDWGEEEGDGNLSIAPGESFEILILCDPGSYKIAVNGQHFCEFRHRIPFNGVSHLKVDGNVELRLIAFEDASPAPQPPRPRPQSGSDFSSSFDVPPPPGNYGQGPPPGYYGPTGNYGQGPPPPQDLYGGGPGRYPHRPPGQEVESGLDSFLGNAGAAIAGTLVTGLAENLLSNFTGGGGQSQHQQRPHSPMQPQQPPYQGSPQQPQYQGGPQQPHGQQSSLVGDLLGSLASEIFKPSRRTLTGNYFS